MSGITERELLQLQAEGWDSELLRLRLSYASLDSVLKYVKPLAGQERIHCHYLPTQKSGRWSTTSPPLPNFSADCINPSCPVQGEHRLAGNNCWSLRDIVVPDAGWFFLKWDWNAIEAKLAAAYSEDDEDLALFEQDADIHAITWAKMYNKPLPPDLRDPRRSPLCAGWRQEVGWQDWYRDGAKTNRYCLAYAIDARAIHTAKDIDKFMRAAGLDKQGVEQMAKDYLESKPKLRRWKRRVWDQIMKTHEVRTPLGRRKRLFVSAQEYALYQRIGRPGEACKQGLNHLAQGQCADMMNRTIIEIKARWPESRFCYQSHDGYVGAWPERSQPWPAIKEVVEQVWSMGNGRTITSTADYECVYADGTHEVLR